MSLIGIDLGTSAIKAAAYAEDGAPLAEARRTVPAHRPAPGQWEVDVRESLHAFREALTTVANHPRVRADPPRAISFSSSGREVFPTAESGVPLGTCLMTADVRGDDVAARTVSHRSVEEWFRLTGHLPQRMDPVNRILWWRETSPNVSAAARWFLNWHEYYSLVLAGIPVVDASDAGAWAIYDLRAGTWSVDRAAELGLDWQRLPLVQRSATPIGPVTAVAAGEFGLPETTVIVTGAWDLFAASVGVGAIDARTLALTCGSWHSFTLPVGPGWAPDLVHEGVSVFPHPGPLGFGLAICNPNGMSVVDWARDLVHLSITELEAGLQCCDPGPGPLFADPTFTPLPHHAGAVVGGLVSQLSLSSTGIDVVRALLEGIACDFSLALDRLRRRGHAPEVIRASGGGSRSPWFMQLHADLTGLPVEVVGQSEPGAFGAALLAGVGSGVFPNLPAAVDRMVAVSRTYEPNGDRGRRYDEVRARLAKAGPDGRMETK